MRPASEVELRRLNDTFAELCAIRSPFGHERAVADRVAQELRALGLEVEEDDAGEEIGGGAREPRAGLPGRRRRPGAPAPRAAGAAPPPPASPAHPAPRGGGGPGGSRCSSTARGRAR